MLGIMAIAFAVACSRPAGGMSEGKAVDGRKAITALGRVTPGRTIVSIGAPPGARVLKLNVAEGKKVELGEILATLDSEPSRKAEAEAAKVALEEARERLAAETAYGEAMVEQGRAAIHLLELTSNHERDELKRISSLASNLAAPEKRLDDQRFLVARSEAELEKAKAELRAAEASLARSRSMVAVRTAEAQVKSAEAALELAIIRAPLAGEILKVLTYPGERAGEMPILHMGDTGDMQVVAEVRESDVGRVRVGQRATITSPALPEALSGKVEEIGLLVFKNNALDPDPRADRDSRVVEVRVKLDQPERVARLTRLEVYSRIETDSAAPAETSARR